MEYISTARNALGMKAKINFTFQPGDVPATYADVNELIKDFNFKPKTM